MPPASRSDFTAPINRVSTVLNIEKVRKYPSRIFCTKKKRWFRKSDRNRYRNLWLLYQLADRFYFSSQYAVTSKLQSRVNAYATHRGCVAAGAFGFETYFVQSFSSAAVAAINSAPSWSSPAMS